jgi:hypothetical protein
MSDYIERLEREVARLKEKLKELKEKEKEVLVVAIEVGGDNGDGNVVVTEKSKGVALIIEDWDNATLPEGDEKGDPIPQRREYSPEDEV